MKRRRGENKEEKKRGNKGEEEKRDARKGGIRVEKVGENGAKRV